MTEYRLSTLWRIEAPIDDVYRTIRDSGEWPQWWSNVERVVDVEPGDDSGLGRVQRYTWKGLLPYRLRFELRVVRIEPHSALEGVVTGELVGAGCWTFSGNGRVTTVRHDWNVRTRRRWMNLLAPIARPLFEWNHTAVMRNGARSLARRLGARLLAGDAFSVRVDTAGAPFDWRAALWAGLAAGVVSTLAQMLAWWGSGGAVVANLLRDTRLTAAILMGATVLPPPAGFDPLVMAVATVVHFALSVVYAAAFGLALRRLERQPWAGGGTVVLAGTLLGLALYLVNLHGFTRWFSWFAQVRGWDTLLAHLVFGAVAAAVYRALARRRPAGQPS